MPVPVCPYANMVQLNPSSTCSFHGPAPNSKRCSLCCQRVAQPFSSAHLVHHGRYGLFVYVPLNRGGAEHLPHTPSRRCFIQSPTFHFHSFPSSSPPLRCCAPYRSGRCAQRSCLLRLGLPSPVAAVRALTQMQTHALLPHVASVTKSLARTSLASSLHFTTCCVLATTSSALTGLHKHSGGIEYCGHHHRVSHWRARDQSLME